jgi:hypothetical protein
VLTHLRALCPLDQRSNGGAVQPKDEVALAVAWNGAIVYDSSALAGENLGLDEGPTPTARAFSRYAQRSPGPQAGSDLATKGTASPDIQSLVNLVTSSSHAPIHPIAASL